MIYIYKCDKCSEKKEVGITTHDIVNSKGIVNQEKLSERMYSKRECECGGEFKKIINHITQPLWFDTGAGWGKISQRTK